MGSGWRVKNMADWVEEWRKHDPHLLDIEGFQRFLAEKELELHVKVTVSLNSGYNQGYDIFLEVPYEEIPEEHRNRSVIEKEERIKDLTEQLEGILKKAELLFNIYDSQEESMLKGLRAGAVHVYRKDDGEWYYYGDESHSGEENIRHNANLLWKVWKAVGSLIPKCFAVAKPFQCNTIYLWCKQSERPPDLPPFTMMRADLGYFLREVTQYGHVERQVDIEDPTEPFWDEMAIYAKAILDEGVPNTYDPFEDDYEWVVPEGEGLPIMLVHKGTIPEVEAWLKEQRLEWDPANDFDIARQGGVEIMHPYLRERRFLVWKEVEWTENAKQMQELYYTRYLKPDLEAMKNDQLKVIVKAKNLDVKHRKHDMIEAILAANYNLPIIGMKGNH